MDAARSADVERKQVARASASASRRAAAADGAATLGVR